MDLELSDKDKCDELEPVVIDLKNKNNIKRVSIHRKKSTRAMIENHQKRDS